MDQATDIYISRVNGSPCGDAVIHLFKGADSSFNQELRRDVLMTLNLAMQRDGGSLMRFGK